MSDPVATGNPSDYIDQSPKEAVEEDIVDRHGQRQRTTLKRHKGHLSVLVNWCESTIANRWPTCNRNISPRIASLDANATA